MGRSNEALRGGCYHSAAEDTFLPHGAKQKSHLTPDLGQRQDDKQQLAGGGSGGGAPRCRHCGVTHRPVSTCLEAKTSRSVTVNPRVRGRGEQRRRCMFWTWSRCESPNGGGQEPKVPRAHPPSLLTVILLLFYTSEVYGKVAASQCFGCFCGNAFLQTIKSLWRPANQRTPSKGQRALRCHPRRSDFFSFPFFFITSYYLHLPQT